MAITAKDVNKLRQETGAGMMDCKKALTEANGDHEAAVDLLRKKGQKISAKRADKDASEGAIFATTSSDATSGFIIAMNCETDFVAKNEEYVALGETIVAAAAASNAGTKEDVLALALADGRSASEHLTDLMGKMGEKIEITAFTSQTGDAVVPYIHSTGKLGVLVNLKGASSEEAVAIGKDVAMQIAAMNPVALSGDDVAQEVKDKEFQIGKEQALAEGKPEQIVDKIATGRVNKFLKENTLLSQTFVKDSKKSVAEVLKNVDANLTVSAFNRVVVG